MPILSGNRSALDVHLQGTIGKFRVSTEDGRSAGVEVKYLLTHVTLTDRQGQSQLLDMLAPVREVFEIKDLDFDEIMQRDIDDSRVSLELIPYLLDTSTSGQIKLFPPIVAVALPLRPTSRVPDGLYRKVTAKESPSDQNPGFTESVITAGLEGEEQFQFKQFLKDGIPLSSDGAQLSLSHNNCALAIVDGQHRAMALLALYRNMKGGWSDARRSPYASYYSVWPDNEIRSYDLGELQLPVLICTFPELFEGNAKNIDVVRAARRVFLTLNKTAKKVSDSRNKLLNDQDIIAECLRQTLSFIKALDVKADTALRIWNVELDQEGDRVKLGSDVAFTGVSHLYHLIEYLLMTASPVRGIEARGNKGGAPRKRLDQAYERLGLKDELTADQKEANGRNNYSDEIGDLFKARWLNRYVPIINRLYAKTHPFNSFGRATIALRNALIGNRDTTLENMLFDGQATARTFDDFHAGLKRRINDREIGWTTPEIQETLTRLEGMLKSRKDLVEGMKVSRAINLLEDLSASTKRRVIQQGELIEPIKSVIDSLFDDVFSTVAFQTALVCTYVEAIQESLGGVEYSNDFILDEYIAALNSLFCPKSQDDLARLVSAFEGTLEFSEDGVKISLGGSTFRRVVLPGELNPAEWPKYRYLIVELWNPSNEKLGEYLAADRDRCRERVASTLYVRRLNEHCQENGVSADELAIETREEILDRCQSMLEDFLFSITSRKIKLSKALFGPTGSSNKEIAASD
jgi:hypothetical protein